MSSILKSSLWYNVWCHTTKYGCNVVTSVVESFSLHQVLVSTPVDQTASPSNLISQRPIKGNNEYKCFPIIAQHKSHKKTIFCVGYLPLTRSRFKIVPICERRENLSLIAHSVSEEK